MDVNTELYRMIIKSRETARRMYAEQRGLDLNDVEAVMGNHDVEAGTIEWLCWERGTFHFIDAHGNPQTW